MPDEDVLRVSTIVDLTGLTTGMAAAAATVESTTERMNGDFAQVSNSVTQMDSTLTKSAAVLNTEAAGATTAAEQIAALQAQIDELNAKLVTLQAQLEETPRRAASEFTEARHAIRGLGEEIGVHMPRFVSSFLTSIEGVAPIMAAAFSVVAIVGLIEMIPQLVQKILDATDAMAGWDAAAKKTYADIIAANQAAYLQMLKTHEEERKMNEIGTTGLMKKSLEQKNATATLAEYTAELAKQLREHQAMQAQLEAAKETRDWDADINNIIKANQEVHRLTDAYALQEKTITALTERVKALGEEEKRRQAEVAAQKFVDYSAQVSAQIGAIRTVTDASVAFAEQSARERLQAGQIGLDEEVAALKTAEDQKYEAEKAGIARRKTLAIEEQKTTGKDAAAELETLEAQREALEVTHQAKLDSITSTGAMERLRMQQAAAEATIAGDEKIAAARAQLAEQNARELRAQRKISIDEETADLKAAETDRFTAEQTALTKRLELAKQFPEKNAALIISLNKEIEALEIQHQAKLQEIQASGDAARLADARKRMNEELAASRESANVQLATVKAGIDAQLKEHQIGITQWRTMQLKALNDWYETERTTLLKELDFVRTVYGEQSAEYQKLIDKLKLLNQELLKQQTDINNKSDEKWQQTMKSMQTEFNSAATAMITGQETMAKIWEKLWSKMAETTIENLLKMIEQMLVAAIMHRTIAKTEILTAAKTAAAKTYESIAAIPYVGPFLAPPAAAAAFAAVMAFGSFQRGGLVQQETVAFLHPREMVLPQEISTPLTNMLRGGAITGPPGPVSAGMGGGMGSPGRAGAQSASAPTSASTHTIHINIQAWDGESVDKWLRSGGGDTHIANSVQRGISMGRLSPGNIGRR